VHSGCRSRPNQNELVSAGSMYTKADARLHGNEL